MRSTLRAARIRQAQVYRRLLRQVLRGIKPPAAEGVRLFIREALDLVLPETASVPESKNSAKPLTAGGWSRDLGWAAAVSLPENGCEATGAQALSLIFHAKQALAQRSVHPHFGQE